MRSLPWVAAVLTLAPAALADPPPPAEGHLTFRADHLEGDTALGQLTLSGHVALAYDRYRLAADRLFLTLDHGALSFDGEARAAFCPCPDPPLTFLASGGRLYPSSDVFLRFPRVAVGGVPVLALPFLWLRAPDEVGLLPPIVSLRGADGLLLGSGVRLPWHGPGGVIEALDLSAGGYTAGGAELGARLTTAGGTLGVMADLVNGTRVALDGAGALLPDLSTRVGVAYAIDAIRGDRARSGTVDLSAAALPFDTAAAEASLRGNLGPASAIVAGGAVARAVRGEGPIAAGPRTTIALGGPLGAVGSWSAGAAGVVLGGGSSDGGALPMGSASLGAEVDARPGPFELRASARARGRFADDGEPSGPSDEAAAAARLDLELPLSRAFPGAPGEAPLIHGISPSITLRGALASQSGPFFVPIGGVVPTASWIAAAGVGSTLGRAAGASLRADLHAGAAGSAAGTDALAHARLAADAHLAAATLEAAAVDDAAGTTRGAAFLGRLRIGPATGLWLRLDAAAQTGGDAGEARAVAAGAWAALPGDDLAYLSAPGWTGGAESSPSPGPAPSAPPRAATSTSPARPSSASAPSPSTAPPAAASAWA